jgi:hypothetical protein
MHHRHINTTGWTPAAIDSILERGDLDDWKELFRKAKSNKLIARDIIRSAERHRDDSTFRLVEWLARKANPEVAAEPAYGEIEKRFIG